MDELRRRRTERLEQAPMQILVRAMVVAAHDVRDPEVDVVDDGREVIRRRAVLAQQRQAFEAIAERSPHLAMALRTLALPHRPLVPGDPRATRDRAGSPPRRPRTLRAGSVSSIRSSIQSPSRRFATALSALPRWSEPVGLGAKRTLIAIRRV